MSRRLTELISDAQAAADSIPKSEREGSRFDSYHFYLKTAALLKEIHVEVMARQASADDR